MTCFEKTWFLSGMGALGQTLHYYDFFFSPSKRTALRGMVSATKGVSDKAVHLHHCFSYWPLTP